MTAGADRDVTVTWTDPAVLAAAHADRDGLALLAAIAAGELPQPPVAALLDAAITDAGLGWVVARLRPGERHANPMGVVAGGVIAALVDLVCGAAAHTTLRAGAQFATTDVQARTVRAVTADAGPLRAEGAVAHRGRQLLTCRAEVTGVDGRLCAHGSAACLVAGAGGG